MTHLLCVHHFMGQAPACKSGMKGPIAKSWMKDAGKLVYADLYDTNMFNEVLASTLAKYQGHAKGKKRPYIFGFGLI